MNEEAARVISRLGLAPLPVEGGFFRVTWTSAGRDASGRALGSAILFLVTGTDFSALHRLRTDEIWHFHAGGRAELCLLDPASGAARALVLGPDPAGGDLPQAVAPAGVWQGARPLPGGPGWTLFGCTLAPAWDEREFELGSRDALLARFPSEAERIRLLTRAPGKL